MDRAWLIVGLVTGKMLETILVNIVILVVQIATVMLILSALHAARVAICSRHLRTLA